MTFVYGNLEKKKKDVLLKGPKHKSGNTFVKIVDASANYWKHNSEWPLNTPRNRKGEKDIEAIFETISIIDLCIYKGMFYSLSCAYLKKPRIRSLS